MVKFTINLMVVGKEEWAQAREARPWYSAKPSPNIVALHRYQQRLGLLTHGEDHWWYLYADGRNEEALVLEVLDAIRDHALPALRAELANQNPGPPLMRQGGHTVVVAGRPTVWVHRVVSRQRLREGQEVDPGGSSVTK